jgi:hypothetical protein
MHEILFSPFSQKKTEKTNKTQAWPSSKYLSSVTGTVCSMAMEGGKKGAHQLCWFEELSPRL